MSEIAQLRQRIESELVAMRRGLSGLSSGSARHAFIHARMDQVGLCQDSLADQVGEFGNDDGLSALCPNDGGRYSAREAYSM